MTRNRLLSALAACASLTATDTLANAKDFVKIQGRGVNLGNMLEAPSEGSWGVTLEKQDLALIASKGFQNVRIPVRWDGKGVGSATFDRASRTEPYAVDPRFFARVDSALLWARQNNLVVVLNDHHHDSLFKNLAHERPRFIAIWKQIAERYKDLSSDSVAFEILNEPNTEVDVDEWNSLLDTTLKVIRATNPTRPVVVGTANWGGLSGLSGLKLPAGDPNIVLTIHYYEPFSFTHQGADWVVPSPPTGVPWDGTYYEKLSVRQAMDAIASYAKGHDVPVFIGEFGAYSMADIDSRARWASFCSRLFESYGFSWSWWEFKAGFGVYDEGTETWSTELMDALISSDTAILAPGTPATGGVDIVTNGGFANKTKWVLDVGQGSALFRIIDSSATVEISDPATDSWGIQLIQKPVVVRKGLTHVLQFDAWASSPRSIDGTVGMSVDPWTGYASAAAGLDTVRKSFFTSFVPGATDSTARISFNLGPDTGLIHLDNVKLYVWDTSSSSISRSGRNPVSSVSWTRGSLVCQQVARPALEWIRSSDGRVKSRLSWTRTGAGWSATVPSLQPGLWVVTGLGESHPIVVPR